MVSPDWVSELMTVFLIIDCLGTESTERCILSVLIILLDLYMIGGSMDSKYIYIERAISKKLN